MTIKLSELIKEKCITVSLRPGPKEEIIREMVQLAARSDRVVDLEAVLQSALEREKQGSTGIGGGIAVPHAKSAGVTELVGALGICREGTDFDSIDGQPAYLVCFLEAVLDNPGPHIQALAKISRLIQTTDFLPAVLKCRTPAEAHRLLRQYDAERIPG
ncbi:MAG: PTS sugar transporter subunit IIA [PVC group bacterium]